MNEKDYKYAKWLNGELSSSELDSLKESGELKELEAIVKATDDMALPKYNLEGAYQQFKKNHPARSAKIISMRARWATGVAASVLLLVAAVFLFRNNEETITAENTAIQSHTFLDGSSVVLNDGSNIIYDKKNWEQQRVVQLTGEAFFGVEKGGRFIAKTPNGNVEVLGTGFNVRAWGDKLYVECYHGRVKVTSAGQEAILTKNESINMAENIMQNKQIINHEKPLWTIGTSRFYEEDVAGVFAEIERQYNVVVNTSVLNRSFSGSFQHDDLNAALNNICKPLNLTYTISGDQKTVTIKESN